jgi:hypothetical protein
LQVVECWGNDIPAGKDEGVGLLENGVGMHPA